MASILIRIIIYALSIALTAALLPGITVANNDIGTLLVIGLVFGLVNAIVKPILMLLTCPFVILSLGLFILVINGLLLMITDSLLGDTFNVDGLLWAIIGGIVMSLISMVLESILAKQD